MLVIIMKWFIYFIIFICSYWGKCSAKKISYTIVPERFETESDPEYFKDFVVKIFRGPNNEYFINQSIELLKPWPADVQIRVTVVQLRKDGRYVQFTKPIVASVCNMIDNDIMIYPAVLKTSNFPKECPVAIGKYYLKDFMVPTETLPPILIQAKGKVNVEFMLGERQLIKAVAHGRIDKV